MTTALSAAPAPLSTQTLNAAIEKALMEGDLSPLSPGDRLIYYRAVCESLGLNPLTRPFDYLKLNGKLVLYARKDATDQLRSLRGVDVLGLTQTIAGELLTVTAQGRDRNGRVDVASGVVAIKGLSGEALANAALKAETKAKRRLTLSLCGLGLTDESEADSIPGAQRIAAEIPERAAEAPVVTRTAETAPAAPAARSGADEALDLMSAIQGAGTIDELNKAWQAACSAQQRVGVDAIKQMAGVFRSKTTELGGK